MLREGSAMVRQAHLKIALLVLLAGCRYFQAQASFQVTVVNAAGEPVPDANILVHKQMLARSDSQGHATVSLNLPLDEAIVLEVNKASTTTFFAPFFETIKIKRGENNFFKVRATLFAVPKSLPSSSPTAEPGAVLATKPIEIDPAPPAPTASPIDSSEGEATSIPAALTSAPTLPGPTEAVDVSIQAEEAAEDVSEAVNSVDSEAGARPLTVYVAAGSQQINEASVLYGDPEQKQWIEGCTSNVRGRCTINLPPHISSDANLDILIRASGYQSLSKSISLTHGDRVRFELTKGQSLEVFAIQKQYETSIGLAGVKVKAGDKDLGLTDNFGYLAAPLSLVSSNSKETLEVRLEAAGHLPEEVTASFAKGGSVSLVQNFQAPEAPRPRILLLPLGQSGGDSANPKFVSLEKHLGEGLRAQLIGQPPFAEADMEVVNPLLSKIDRSPQSLSREGWAGTELASEFEFMLRPHLILNNEGLIELALINAQAKVIAAVQAPLPSKATARSLRPLMRRLSQELAQYVPFEGAIAEGVKDGFRINLGKDRGYALKEGELLQLWGMQSDGLDRQKKWGEIGLAKVVAVGEKSSRIYVTELKPRSTARVGDSVRLLRSSKRSKDDPAQVFKIQNQADHRPLAQADFYYQKHWQGSTDAAGKIAISSHLLGRRGPFEIVRPGYRPLILDLLPSNAAKNIIAMQRDVLIFRVESVPSQSLVKLNGRVLGRTPLYQTIQAPPEGSQLELSYSEDYRPFQQAIALDDEGIDFSGERTIRLEIDIRRQAKQLLEHGRIPEAISLLEGIAETHPDYALAQHELGEIFLNQQHDPVRAASIFHRVTTRPNIADFADKRFIGTYINEAMALYTAGEKTAALEPSTALSYWKQSVEILDRTEEQLRFIPQDRYTQALHSLYYYRALSLHRTWALTQNQTDLEKANRAWKDYIQNTALSSPSDRNYATLKKAEVFFKQTQTLMKDSVGSQPAPEGTRSPIPTVTM